MMIESKVTPKQERSFTTSWSEDKDVYIMTATVRFDDRCRNGHNTFSITSVTRRNSREDSGGCQHEEIAIRFPELSGFIKWHLCSTEGPMHYLANTQYHASQGKLDYARSSAIWPEATLEQLQDMATLKARLPQLLVDFRRAVELLGFTW